MHDIQPYHQWTNKYITEEDKNSPFYKQLKDESKYTHQIYNYIIHPQWDYFGSPTLYIKILFVDYDKGYAIFEFIGEWNDCITNDIMFLKRDVADYFIEQGIYKFILISENVLNFHASDLDYYEEWLEDVQEHGGYIVMINALEPVIDEMQINKLHYYINFGGLFNQIIWRGGKPSLLKANVEQILKSSQKQLSNGQY